MFKKLSKLLVIFSIILSLSLSLIACGDGDGDGGSNQPLPEYVNLQAYTKGIHDFTNTDSDTEWLVKDGKTDYVLYVPAVQSEKIKTAIQEFQLLFFDATGINIDYVLDTTPAVENGKYISLGENALFESIYVEDDFEGYDANKHITKSEFDKANLKEDGVRILTKGKTVYLLGGLLDTGVVNAVYTFMNLHFNYEYFYRNCITIDKDVTDEKLKIFNVKDVPDIDRRCHNVAWYSKTYDIARNADLNTGLELADIVNRGSRSRLTGSQSADFLPAYDIEGYKASTHAYIHNVQEYFPNSNNENSTLYVNYEKYFHDEYKPEGYIELDPFAPSRYNELLAAKYGADDNGDGIPDSWVANYGDGDSINAYEEHGYAMVNSETVTHGSSADWWHGVTPCHTGHGNANSYEAMKKRVTEVIMLALRRNPVAEYPNRRTMLFSIEDAGTPCSCDACTVYKDRYGAVTAAINRFLNDVVRSYVRPWMQKPENAEYRRDDFVLSYFCYSASKGVPVCTDETYRQEFENEIVCDPNVGVYIAGISGLINNSHMHDAVCQYEIDYLNKWDEICDNMMIWGYSINANAAIYFTDSLTTYSSEFYQQLANNGVYFMFNESQDIGEEATCWQNWSSYYQSKLMWDTTLETGPLFDAFFDAMYLDASDTMKEIYTRMRVHRQVIQDEFGIRNKSLQGTQIANEKFWPLGVLNDWYSLFQKALGEVEKYKSVDPKLYDWLYEHIELEMLTPAFISLHVQKDNLTPAVLQEYKNILYSVTDKFPNLDWKGSYSSNIRAFADSL
ncbi:MAG: DUF4838 domain-containing protein [Clostridia bacterium]|nr:DUF4838 domain-containing protein [Clostridia bacterium]